jgi:hypothetical protein
VLESIAGVRTSQSETTRIMNQTEQKLDDLHNTTQETQRALHELAARFVLLDAKSRVWARQNEQLLRSSIQKSIQDSFQQLLLPALVSKAQEKQRLRPDVQTVPLAYLSDGSDLSPDPADLWSGIENQWEIEPRIVELPDHLSLQTTSWNQKDQPPHIAKRCRNPTPADLRFLRFTRQSSFT